MEQSEFQNGNIYDIEIIDFGVNGEGVGKSGDFVIFVPKVVPGDKVRVQLDNVKKNYSSGKLVKILEYSKDRETPVCKNFGICGGCNYLHFNYDAELLFKKKKVNDALKRIGNLDFEIDEIIGMDEPYYYRNKAIYHVTQNKGKINIGFYGARSKDTVSVSGCKMYSSVNEKILLAFREYMEESKVQAYDYKTKQGLVKAIMIRQSSFTGDILVCIVASSRHLPNSAGLIYRLSESVKETNDSPTGACAIKGIVLNISKSKNREVLGEENKFIWGDQFIIDKIDDLEFKISASSFFQVNSKMTPVLYKKVLEYANLSKEETVIDAYSGTGTISLMLAKSAKEVTGIELVPQSIGDALINAENNNIQNVKFIQGDAGRIFDNLFKDDVCPDVLVLDPPRGGCGEYVISGLRKLSPKRIVYISCDPATLARDLKDISEFGYKIEKGICLDMFGRSGHVECVVLMSRKDG